ncbi:MAG: bifunctional demethylmenaquinone methyltransferase/2-methoxy-6-polyprenyl-1,4-benzoquinol methylase UbiE [Proteobacteria bacterium]|nr:bifunctional demethylmenaquinone methyltransferase/2-methoxy-6-polyprenyl-1,4-benzoquinol methylase UbiE [Pseudomonadota bacterium]
MPHATKHKKKAATRLKVQETIDFGFEQIRREEKKARVGEVFTSVASKYDIMNDLMSAGLHRLWKDTMVGMVPLTAHAKILDVAGGTGDIAFRMHRRFEKAGVAHHITVSDINPDMLGEGKKRAVDQGYLKGFSWKVADAEALPFEDNSFDVYTIAFGIRNVTDRLQAMKEAYRVLKTGGKLLVMEFSHLELPLLQRLYDAYSFSMIPFIGEKVSGDRAAYQYLVESIRAFPKPEAFAALIEQAGFENVQFRRLHLGVVAIHSGWKV